MTGLALNFQLLEREGTLFEKTHSASRYRMVLIEDQGIQKPGLVENGISFPLEIWRIPSSKVGSFLSLITYPLGLGQIQFIDETWGLGFICQNDVYPDISKYGGWRKFLEQQEK